jgi:predicted MFS family arabinose efflux permease
LSIIAVSFRRIHGKKPATLRPVNARNRTGAHLEGPRTPNESRTPRVTALPAAQKVPTRSIILLAGAGFASQAMVRVTDSLLPQIAADFGTTVGEASIVVAAYAVSHGSIQLIIGPVGDRFGKYRTVAVMCALAAVLVGLCGSVQSLSALAVARFASGAAAGWIIPLSMAYVGDVTPYERRQPILARYLSGQIFGQLFGQAAGGVLGDLMGWRNVFFVLAAMFALATVGLIFELLTNPRTRAAGRPEETSRGFVADYAAVLSNPWARIVILAVFIEASVAWGAFAYVGADLHLRFGLSFTAVGLIVGTFGIGGLLYAASVQQLVTRLGQPGLAIFGGVMMALAYAALALGAVWWLAPIAVTAIGLGFYALHNTLQTNATQMTPEARGTAVAIFSSAIYLGQTLGVAAGALVFDRFTAVPLFLVPAVVLPVLAWWFAMRLKRRAIALSE